jgi:hypothetical protein
MMSQALELLFSCAFLLMMTCVAINAGSVRLLRARGASFREALRRVSTTRWFWIGIICLILTLKELTLVRLQEFSLLVSGLQSLAIVVVIAAVVTLASFWVVGLWSEERKAKERDGEKPFK